MLMDILPPQVAKDVRDDAGEDAGLNRDLLYSLLDSYLKNDVVSIQEYIVHHVS